MAQWVRLLKLEPEFKSRVSRLYQERKVPIEIRRSLSQWIEEQDWDSAAADEATARTCFQALMLELDELIKQSLYNNHTLEGPDFSPLKEHLMNHFEGHPLELAEKLSECLKEEKLILNSGSVEQDCGTTTREHTQTDLDNKVNLLKYLSEKSEEEIKALEKEESIYKPWESQVKLSNDLANHQMQQQCLNQENSIRTKRQALVDHLKQSLTLAAQIIQTLVSAELPDWKRQQQMSCIGNPVNRSLDQLEKWFTSVGEVLLQIVQQLMKLQTSDMFNMSDVLQKYDKFTVALLRTLFKNALVVEKQPVTVKQPHRPLVLRTKVLFTVKLRYLANLAILKDRCSIKAEFDKDVEEVRTIKGFRQFHFSKTNRPKALVVDENNGSLVAEWHQVIEEITAKRERSNKSQIRVTEELHLIKFSTDLQVPGLQCQVETSSLPVVVVSTTTQCPSAWASVMWYNLLSVTQPTSLSVFLDPPPLSWEKLSQALSWQFISAGDRGLNQDQLNELKLRITDDPDELVYWSKFSNLTEGSWIWIDGILDLIEKHLKVLWRDGYIMGFVSKEKTHSLLQRTLSGNFLLRFSESNREGAISFSVFEGGKQKTNVRYIAPFTKDELSKMPLADCINQYREKGRPSNPLVYLYPDIPKDNAFGRYYTPTETSKPITPYVRRTFFCEGDCPTPPASSPEHTQMDLAQDLMDIPTSELLQTDSSEENELFQSVYLYDNDNNMDVSEGF